MNVTFNFKLGGHCPNAARKACVLSTSLGQTERI